jgi:histidinol-phosphate aminotransferase
MDIQTLIRPEILTMEPYTPILPFEILSARLGRAPANLIKLDANENPYGPSPKALAALATLQFPNIYPDPDSTALRSALSLDLGLPSENILCGAGADELIDLVLRLFIRPSDSVIDCPPTFGMYSFDTAINAGTLIKVSRRTDFSIDVDAILQATSLKSPKVIFVTSPNNPDGSLIADDDLRHLLALPVVVVLDEAYIEFSGALGHAAWVLAHDNLIVLRTFSKRAGLAGLRVGYGLFPLALMPHLWKIKQPYNVSVAASAAAIASLADAVYMSEIVTKLVTERNRMAAALSELPFLTIYPSWANFILCRVQGREAKELKLQLEQQGILVRYFNKPGLTDCIRISAGKPEHTDALMSALKALT